MNSRVSSLCVEMVVLKKLMKGMIEIITLVEDGEDLIENIRNKWDEQEDLPVPGKEV